MTERPVFHASSACSSFHTVRWAVEPALQAAFSSSGGVSSSKAVAMSSGVWTSVNPGTGTPASRQIRRIRRLSRAPATRSPAPRSPSRRLAWATATTAYSDSVSTAAAPTRRAWEQIRSTSSTPSRGCTEVMDAHAGSHTDSVVRGSGASARTWTSA